MTRYEFTLSDDLLSKAVEKLNEPESNADRLVAIDSLRAAFKRDCPDIKLFSKNDKFLLKFLRAKKFQEDDALRLLISYHIQLNEWPEAFDKMNNPDEMEPVLSAGVSCPLNGRAKNGSGVLIVRHGKEHASLLDGIAVLILALDQMLDKEENQINGIILIQDLAYATPRVIWQFEPQILKKFLKLIYDGLPVTIENTFVVNQPALFSVALAILKRISTQEENEKQVLIGKNYRLLNQYVDKSVLPPSVGGTGPDCDAEFWKRKILKSHKYY